MGKQLVLVGGGHAHMVTLANLSKFIVKGHDVTVIAPSPYHYYSGMGPGMLGKVYAPEDIRFATQAVVEKQGGRFVPGKAVRVEPGTRSVHLESGETVAYDVVSFNVGSYVPRFIVKTDDTQDICAVKPIEKLIEAQARILELGAQQKTTISIIGGGPSAAEIAGNLWRLTRGFGANKPNIRIFAGQKFMSNFSEEIRKKVAGSLTKRRIEILEASYVKEVQTKMITTEAGQRYHTDFVFLALGVKPAPIFVKSGLPAGPDGGLLVNSYLQSPQHPEIFDKVGVYAVRQNPILFHNLMASLEKTALKPFDPGGDYLLVFNMGDDTGVLRKKWLLFGGRLAFAIKDYIDRKFMKKFQSIE